MAMLSAFWPTKSQQLGTEQGDAEAEHVAKATHVETEPRRAAQPQQPEQRQAVGDKGLHDERPVPGSSGDGDDARYATERDRRGLEDGESAEVEGTPSHHRRDDGEALDDQAAAEHA